MFDDVSRQSKQTSFAEQLAVYLQSKKVLKIANRSRNSAWKIITGHIPE